MKLKRIIFLMCIFTIFLLCDKKASAAYKFNKSKIVVKVGECKKLKLIGNASKIKWTYKNSKIATGRISDISKTSEKVNKIVGRRVGKTSISAKVNGKILKCTIIVKKANGNITKKQAVKKVKTFMGSEYAYVSTADTPYKFKGKKYWAIKISEFVQDHFTNLGYYFVSKDGTVFCEGIFRGDDIVLY